MKRKSLLTLFAAMMTMVGSFVACEPVDDPEQNTLTLSPEGALTIEGHPEGTITLMVTTDADSWDAQEVEAKGWLTLTKAGTNRIVVTATDNDTNAPRTTKFKVTAGNADAITVNVYQKIMEDGGDQPPVDGKVDGQLKDQTSPNIQNISRTIMKEAITDIKLKFSLVDAATTDVKYSVELDPTHLDAYNALNGTSCQLFPSSLVTINGGSNLTLAAGDKVSGDIKLELNFDETLLEQNVKYLVPLYVKTTTDNMRVTDKCRVNYVITRMPDKQVRNIIWFEVNDANPLNALELKLDDGTQFADAVVLFSDNIVWDASGLRIATHNPSNNQLHRDHEELQRLRDAGIKVYLCITPYHTTAGTCNLSDVGSTQFANTIAQAIHDWEFDGVGWDEEYRKDTGNSSLFEASSTISNFARLAYKTKQRMKELSGTGDNIIFQYSTLTGTIPDYNGVPASEFIDIINANYGSAASPRGNGLTKANCSYMSIEMGLGGSGTIQDGINARVQGYGWIMWYGYHPVSRMGDWSKMAAVAKGMYPGRKLVKNTGYWAKSPNGADGTENGGHDWVRKVYGQSQLDQMVELEPLPLDY